MSKQRVNGAKCDALRFLQAHGIHDSFTVRVKQPHNSNWVAMYRAGSQFRNGGRGPIFWLSEELLNDKAETIISILHEYGHVIAEFFYFSRKPELINLISQTWVGEFHDRPWDEEQFAEDFAQYLYREKVTVGEHKAIDSVIKAYIEEMNC